MSQPIPSQTEPLDSSNRDKAPLSGWTTPPSCPARSRLQSTERKRGSVTRRTHVNYMLDETDPTDSCMSHSVPTTTLCTPREEDLSTPIPLEEFEKEAEQMEREALEEAVERLRCDNVVLRNKVNFSREQLNTFNEDVKEAYGEKEQQQENTINTLMRRLNRVKERRNKLHQRLQMAEKEAEGKQQRLKTTKESIDKANTRIQKEESQIAERLRHQLTYFQTQRLQLSRVLAEQTSTVQDLERLLDEMPASSSFRGSSREPSSARTADDSNNNSTGSLVDHGPHDVARYLSQEIDAVEEMRAEMMERATLFARRREDLEKRLQLENQKRREAARKNEEVRRELEETRQAVAEASVAQLTLDEMESERAFNLQTGSSVSSTGPSPRMSFTHQKSRDSSIPRVQDALLVPHPSKYAMAGALSSSQSHTPRHVAGGSPADDSTETSSHGHRTSSIKVQDTSRMEPPRPLGSEHCTPKRMPMIPSEVDAPPLLSLHDPKEVETEKKEE